MIMTAQEARELAHGALAADKRELDQVYQTIKSAASIGRFCITIGFVSDKIIEVLKKDKFEVVITTSFYSDQNTYISWSE